MSADRVRLERRPCSWSLWSTESFRFVAHSLFRSNVCGGFLSLYLSFYVFVKVLKDLRLSVRYFKTDPAMCTPLSPPVRDADRCTPVVLYCPLLANCVCRLVEFLSMFFFCFRNFAAGLLGWLDAFFSRMTTFILLYVFFSPDLQRVAQVGLPPYRTPSGLLYGGRENYRDQVNKLRVCLSP